MIRLSAIKVPLDTTEAAWREIAAGLLRVPCDAIDTCTLVKRSVDARRKEAICLVLTLDIAVHGDEASILRRCKHPQAALVTPAPSFFAGLGRVTPPAQRPVVVGSGPAGLFAALALAKAGARPLLIERGEDATTRRKSVQAFWTDGTFSPASNVQFGEGGAGTFSDGKLNTGIKDPRCRAVLETFVQFGAPEEILWQAKPHIGTDYLVAVVQTLRGEIERLGGEVLFGTQLTGLNIAQGTLRGIRLHDRQVDTDTLVLAIGHSARDTFVMLHEAGLEMVQKPFSIGARIEHPQALINTAQYGRFAGHAALGAAEYKLSTHLPDGRGVYSFCMCPGGVVVAAASESGGVVTNGMSRFARDGANANSALLVDVRPSDFTNDDPLAGMRFQRHWEQLAFRAGGGDYRAPAQMVGDLLAGRASRSIDSFQPTYRPGVTPANLRDCLPAFAVDAMAKALGAFDRQLKGFASADAVFTGVETRSSCPLRILRDPQGQANIRGIFPAGEGAGYAGGITSAAVDGIRAAEKLLSLYSQEASR